jgi:hypothetical protein
MLLISHLDTFLAYNDDCINVRTGCFKISTHLQKTASHTACRSDFLSCPSMWRCCSGFWRFLLSYGYQRFGETCCIHLQGWMCRKCVSVKRWHLHTRLHGAKTRKNNVILKAVRKSIPVFLKLPAIADHFIGGRCTRGPPSRNSPHPKLHASQ